MDAQTTVAELKERMAVFSRERDWEQFHNPRDLAIHMAVEAAELLDHFRYKKDDELPGVMARKREDIEDELADVVILALEFARMNGIDLSDAVVRKLAKSAAKYPVGTSKGVKKKYNEL